MRRREMSARTYPRCHSRRESQRGHPRAEATRGDSGGGYERPADDPNEVPVAAVAEV